MPVRQRIEMMIGLILQSAVVLAKYPLSPNWTSILDEVKDLGRRNGTAMHRSYIKIGRSVEVCMKSLQESAKAPSMLGLNESKSLQLRTCRRSTSWGPVAENAAAQPTRTTSTRAQVLFVIAAYIKNGDNAHVFDLCLGSVMAFHPETDLLVADNDSPARDLLYRAVEKRRVDARAAGITASIDIISAHGSPGLDQETAEDIIRNPKHMGNSSFGRMARSPPGREIGSLRAAIIFINKRQRLGGRPPDYIAFLLHSTGLRMPLPLSEIVGLIDDGACNSFALEIPWFRYESRRHVKSRYGMPIEISVSSCNLFSLCRTYYRSFVHDHSLSYAYYLNSHI
jgi:hypothetical protein